MSNWKLINKTYLYDGTFSGFLTIVFDSYSMKTLPQKINKKDSYLTNFLDKTIEIETNSHKAQMVLDGIEKMVGYPSLYNSYYAFLSNEKEKELIILKYLCDAFDMGPKINNNLTTCLLYTSPSPRDCS